VNDGKPDVLQLKYAGLQAYGLMFVLTDMSDIITSVHFNVPDLEGSGAGVIKLWIVTSCFETFDLQTGIPISSLTGQLDYSNAITITKNSNCAPICEPEVVACPGKVLMCINNVSTCVAQKDVNKKLKAGGKMGGCIRCRPANTAKSAAANAVKAISPEPAMIYPNPARTEINILCAFGGAAVVDLTDLSGRIIYRKVLNMVEHTATRIDLSANRIAPGCTR
jgi:hypothetical protein